MEKFFIITEESEVHKDYFEYRENVKIINEHFKKFTDQYNITSHQYFVNNEIIYIVPNAEDLEKFNSLLKQDIGNGLRPFKKNSTIGKAWVKSLKDNNLKVLRKPDTMWYFKEFHGGKFSTRLFDIDGVIYSSFRCESDSLDCPKGFKEIKASEFYKIIEDNEN